MEELSIFVCSSMGGHAGDRMRFNFLGGMNVRRLTGTVEAHLGILGRYINYFHTTSLRVGGDKIAT